MTGEQTSRNSKKLISKESFFGWLDAMKKDFRVFGPVRAGGQEGQEGQTVFREMETSGELFMEYDTTMISPGKLFVYRPREELFKFTKTAGTWDIEEIPPPDEKQIIAGIHPCDTNALIYLDRTFLGAFKDPYGVFRDPYYEMKRKNTLLISLNCMAVSPNCFCSSVGTGPFLKTEGACDMLLTDFEDEYLVEIKSRRAEELFTVKGKKAGAGELKLKAEKGKSLLRDFKKTINVDRLDGLFARNMEHPIWQHTADERCLSCSNCVMVCPTCFCYNIADETSIDLSEVIRYRHWDACQDIRFAEVHGGNFRGRRASRLRQFVTHKLDHRHQYGILGTVGCGRCITWCPTGIDLTEIAAGIMHEPA